jgi:multiple sugar transport system substrate-binding protein
MNPLRQQQAALYEKLHPNVKVNIDPANEGVEKVIVQSIAGVGPDVFDAVDSFQLAAYVKSGIAMDVTNELEQSGIDLKTQVFPGVLPMCMVDGHVYGVPDNVGADGIWFHADILREAGVALPTGGWTWDQFIPIAEKLTKRTADGRISRYGFLFEWWNWRHFFSGFGASVFNANGSRCILDSPNAIAAIQLMYDLVYKYHVSPTPVEETSMAAEGGFGSGYITLMAAKRGAMALGGRWWLAQLRQTKGLELRVAESPYGTVHATHENGRGLLVNKNSKHLEEALRFQRYMSSDAYCDLINDQADALAAFKRADEKPSFFFNPKYPEEKDNAVWLKIVELGVAEDISPFVDASSVTRLMQTQLDLVQNGQKSPKQAMTDAAANINAAIEKTVAEDPSLAERYRTALQGSMK